MINIIKIGNNIFERIRPFNIDEEGNKIWNIPTDVTELKNAAYDTVAWLTSRRIIQTINDANKKDTATSKAIVLLAKIVNSLSPDLSQLSANEQAAFSKMLQLADSGYSDSELLNTALQGIIDHLNWYNEKISELDSIDNFDDLVNFLENL